MKKRILALLLALLMVVSIIPFNIFAEGDPEPTPPEVEGTSEPTTEPVTDPPCDTCGAYDCESEHLNWCADCRMDDCGKTHVFCEICQKNDCGQNHCPTCGTIDCTKEHKECDKCGTMDCTADHTNWCDICKADNCGKEHKTCDKCEAVDCTADHTNWCAECKKDDCGVDHNATEPTEAPANEIAVIDDGENTSPYHANIGRKAQFDLTYSHFPIVSDPAGITSGDVFGMDIAVSKDVIPADMIVKIADCYVNEAEDIYWYKIEAAEGYSLPAEFPTPAWVFQDNVSYSGGASLILLDEEPENTCECGCENCTGAEGCECKCGECDFCEKEEEPEVPSISATVTDSNGNQQTVTVSGDALPEGATLKVTPIRNMEEIVSQLGWEGKFVWDIKILDKDGNEWKPTDAVELSLPITGASDDEYIDIVHFLEDHTEIETAIEKGHIAGGEIVSFCPNAVTAYKEVTGEDGYAAHEIFEDLQVKNGYVSFLTNSFSIYTASGSYLSDTDEGGSRKIVMGQTTSTTGSNGKTFYVTKSHRIYMDRGGSLVTSQSWSTSNSSIGSFDGSNTDKYFNLNGSAALGTQFTITYKYRENNAFNGGIGNKTITVTFVIVEERTTYFNANGGSCSTSSAVAVTDGNSHHKYITLPAVTRTGYTPTGWYTAASGGTKIGDAGASYMPASSGGTLYAQWEPIKYTVKFDPNTANAGGGAVTGSMPTLNMTYDVETTLPRNQFVNQGDGMVFLGWATSPDGNVVYKDGAKIKNLTAANNATVTLYAKWKYGLASTVYIGINNTYHNPNGTYTAGGVTINSYHTYPNEPAQMTGDFDRVTDKSGSWAYHSASAVELKNQAASYINGNIFNSPDYKMTYVEGENTLGIADPTGEIVRAMLKFSEADYQAMIAAWLNGMRSTLAGYGDTSVDWQNAKPEDFVMVPYVIKFQNYDSWYIDMVVKPKALYTLAYDGNIENGYTASFTGVAFPPSAQHTEGTNVSVVSTPIGYQNNNLKVTKVIDGHTYTAEFQYWYDAKGNTYGGSTGRNTITLTEDTILYAKWNYPDASFGNLNITKTVVDKDAYEDPSATQTFTFKFTTSAAGSYSYTIYDRAANVKTTGTIANNGTFTLQDGWRIRITDLPKGATYTVTETAVNYYTAFGKVNGTISAGATTYATVTNTYQKHAGYTVKHYLQKADGIGYTEQNADQQSLYGIIGQSTSAQAKTYSGYTVKTLNQAAIQADGSTVINIYYDLISTATVIWKNWDGNVLEKDENVSHGEIPHYDGETPKKAATAQYTYTFDGWDKEVVAVTGDVTYTAKYKETVNKYTITFVDENGTTVLKAATEYAYGTAAADIVKPADPKKTSDAQYDYKFAGWTPTVVAVTGEATYKATYTPVRRSYTITWKNDDGSTIDTTTVQYGDIPSHAAPSKASTDEYTYTFSSWTPALVAVTGDAIYTANYTATKNQYEVTFVDEDGTVLKAATKYDYGTPAADIVKPADPVKASDTQCDYKFAGWSPAIQDVTGQATYKATYTSTVRSYTVTWKDGDGKTLQSGPVPYNTRPGYSGATPTKTATDQYTYTFNGKWSPEITAVTGDVTYTAQFDQVVNKYTVTWVDGNGNTLKTEQVAYGDTPVYSGDDPTKTATAQYTYTWSTENPWSPVIESVTGDATYNAQFDQVVNKYTITWIDGDGNTLKTEDLDYGATPNYTGETPTKTSTEALDYTFSGSWSPAIVPVEKDAAYTAQFTSASRTYTVTWWQDKDGDGKIHVYEVLKEDEVAYNTKLKYNGTEPSKEPTQQYWYNFEGWKDSEGNQINAYEEITVTGNRKYQAILNPKLMEYYVTWLVEGVEKDKKLWKYGDIPSYGGETPTKADDDGYTYQWDGEWTPVVVPVEDEVKYEAIFTKTAKKFQISYELAKDGMSGTVNGENPVEYTVESDAITLINPTPAQPYYQFIGWTGTGLTGPTIEVTIPKGSTGDRAYTANYALIDYTIHFDGNGAEKANPADIPYNYGDTVTLPTVTKTGHTYEWKVDTQNGDWTPGEKVESGVMNHYGDVTLKAEWTPIQYKIQFHGNAAEVAGTTAELTMTYDVEKLLTANGFTRDGYQFLGWSTAQNSTTATYTDQEPVKNLAAVNGAVVDLYAVWKLNTVSLIIRTVNTVDNNQSYIFDVTGRSLDGEENIKLQVVLAANDEQTIVGLPAGKYTVADQNGWSWRYEHMSAEKDIHSTTVIAEFGYSYNQMLSEKVYWLNGYGNEQIKTAASSNG